MTDLTSSVSTLLVSTHKSTPLSSSVSFSTLDSFLTEAKQINATIRDFLTYIRAIRTPYLSTAPPPRRYNHNQQKDGNVPARSTVSDANGSIPAHITDAQRLEIDSQTSTLLREIGASLSAISEACTIQHSLFQERMHKKYGKSSNFLLRWAAGDDGATNTDVDVGDAGKSNERIEEEGREKTVYVFREGVVWYLNWKLNMAVQRRQEMVEKRLDREREKGQSMLDDERNRYVRLRAGDNDEGDDLANLNIDMRGRDTYSGGYNPALGSGDGGGGDQNHEQELTPEQLQLFEEENTSLMTHYNETLTQVTQVEKSLLDISSLQQTLIGHLEVQGEMIGGLVEDAQRTDENVQRGNKELKKATERTSTAKIMYHSTLWICLGLVVWDAIF